MKTKLKHIGLAALLLAGVLFIPDAHAQTNLSQVPDQFYGTAFQWATSIDTNKDWRTIDLEVATGYKQVNGIGAASDLTAQYNFGRWNAGAWIQFSGVGSAIDAAGAQGGYAIIQDGDLKLETNLRVGYGRQITERSGGVIIEPEIALTKLMTKNTLTKIGLSLPQDCKRFNNNPTFYVEVGFGHIKHP